MPAPRPRSAVPSTLSAAHLAPVLAALFLCGCDTTPGPQTPASASSVGGPSSGGPSSSGPSTDAPGAPPAPGPGAPTAAPSKAEAGAFARASNHFGFDLHARLRKKPGNFTYSPASISTALAMTWGGAAGSTADEMRAVLHFEGSQRDVLTSAGKLSAALQDPKRPVVLAIANRLFGEKTFTFEKAFLAETADLFGAPLEPVDFAKQPQPSRQRINAWVSERTKTRIQDLVPPTGVTSDTRLALVNAVYFLGDWQDPFKKEATSEQPFLVAGTTEKKVPTMRQVASFATAELDGARVVELPYRGGELSMVVVVPTKADGLPDLEAKLDVAQYGRWVEALVPTRVSLSLPKFEVNPASSMPLGDVLIEMGMKTAFDRGRADFTKMANPPNPDDRLSISAVFHKAFVKVDEKGTEAAAATAVMMSRAGGMPEQPKEVKIDRPFLFFLRDVPSGLVLFTGRVVDPSVKG